MKVDPPFLHSSEGRKRSCKKEYGTYSPPFTSPPSKHFPAADRNESQAWMNRVEISRGTRAVRGPSQCHTAVQSLERLQNSHLLQFGSPHEEPCTWQLPLFSAFYHYSHVVLSLHTNEEHLCSSCPLYLQPKRFLC